MQHHLYILILNLPCNCLTVMRVIVLNKHHLVCSMHVCYFLVCPIEGGGEEGGVGNSHCVKSVRIGSYSGPHFPAFRLNTERYYVSLRIQSECVKMWTRITSNTDTFYAVSEYGSSQPTVQYNWDSSLFSEPY